MVEVMIAVMVVTVAVSMLSSTLTASMGHSNSKRERSLALDAAMNVLERMRAVPFSEVYALYNATPSDDPDGLGTAPGPFFSVAGLDPPLTERGVPRPIGTVHMPGEGPTLREDVSDTRLGLPRDLNGDLVVDDLDHAGDAILLPVRVVIEWRHGGGVGKLELTTLLSALEKVQR